MTVLRRGAAIAASIVLTCCELQLGFSVNDATSSDEDADDTASETVPCLVDEDCDDGLICNGHENCEDGACVPGEAVVCEDGDDCTTDRCLEETGECTYLPRDEDDDGYVDEACGGDDCHDGDESIHPGGFETECNGVDNDCDGDEDEDYTSYRCGVGECGTDSVCTDGVETCVPLDPPSETDELCDGLDSNCDGEVDEDYVPYTCGRGYCESDSTCVSGVESCTEGSPLDVVDATCDDMDDDCDGGVDEDYVSYTCGRGYCESDSTCVVGVESCTEGSPLDVVDTTCDGVDDDCDGLMDDNYIPTTCGVGECEAGASCESGTEVCTPFTPLYTTDEVCNDLDEDCDGSVDEDYVTYSCGTGYCEATSVCTSGLENCTPGSPLGSVDTTCDGVDDDCDGSSDEEYVPYACGVGICLRNSTCVSGVDSCTPGTPSSSTDTVCDDLDEDCDGSVDEDYVIYTCGVGVCERDSRCIGGVESCTEGTPTGTDNDCDAVDEDCDGTADEHWMVYTCGDGVCERSATCVSGVESCIPGTPATEICGNGIDEDCDGTPDNGC